MALWEIQEYVIKPQLRRVPGVAEVNAYGGYVKQIVVQPNIAKLRDAGLTVSDLAKVVGENVENAGGGVVDAGGDQLVIRGVGRVVSLEEIAELPVKFAAAVMPLRVKDLAEVQIGHAFRTGAGTHDGREALVGVAMMLMGENSHAVAERVAEKVEEIQKRLPRGCCHQPGIQQEKPGPSNNSHRRHQSFRRRLACHSCAAFAAGKLARRSNRRISHPAGIPFCRHWNAAIRHFRQFDEPRRDRFWTDHRRRGGDRGKRGAAARRKTASTWTPVNDRGAATHSRCREQASRYSDVFWRVDHRHCLCPDSSALRESKEKCSTRWH